jgi:hypothetical protein
VFWKFVTVLYCIHFVSLHRTFNLKVFFEDGIKSLHPAAILVRCEHNLYIVWSIFKPIGVCLFFEIVTTSKEIM